MDSDKVLVMSEGRVAEYDSPANLLQNNVSPLLYIRGSIADISGFLVQSFGR